MPDPTRTASPASQHAEIGDPARPDDAVRALAARQAALVACLVAGAPDPDGFDAARLAATRRALLRKRAGVAATAWPVLAASLGRRWSSTFADQHAGHESGGALRDGWDLARALRGELSPEAAAELAEQEALLRYDGVHPPTPRRLGRARLAVRRALRRERTTTH